MRRRHDHDLTSVRDPADPDRRWRRHLAGAAGHRPDRRPDHRHPARPHRRPAHPDPGRAPRPATRPWPPTCAPSLVNDRGYRPCRSAGSATGQVTFAGLGDEDGDRPDPADPVTSWARSPRPSPACCWPTRCSAARWRWRTGWPQHLPELRRHAGRRGHPVRAGHPQLRPAADRRPTWYGPALAETLGNAEPVRGLRRAGDRGHPDDRARRTRASTRTPTWACPCSATPRPARPARADWPTLATERMLTPAAA